MNLQEYAQYDALGLAELVQRRSVTPRELAALALQAIAQINPQINAIIGMIIEDPDQIDEAALPDGPFRGVPFLIKDLVIHAAGVPTDMGSRLTQGVVFPHDSELMARYKRAGFVTLGRTNAPEFGSNVTTEPVLHGPTRNPWNTNHSSGGSSGGSAAAVAARIVPVAHANDGGGSIRIPASTCGLVGLKPSRGRVSLAPDFGEALLGLGIELAVTRTVRDCAAILDAVHGAAPGEPYVIAPPERSYSKELKGGHGKYRIAYTTTAFNGLQSDPACVEVVAKTVQLLESLGHEVVEAAPEIDFEAVLEASVPAWAGWTAGAVENTRLFFGRTPTPELMEATSWALYQEGLKTSGLDVMRAIAIFNQTNRAMGAFMQEYDLLLTPTMPKPPAELGTYNADDPSQDAQSWIRWLLGDPAVFTAMINITGQPAISLPLYQSADGLPIGSHFVGRMGDEATLLRLARQLEEAQPWIDRKPPVSL
ncbi:MAG: amidase [Chloroflexi bacterium]|nr:amidase [Chloroflexota bacterium]